MQEVYANADIGDDLIAQLDDAHDGVTEADAKLRVGEPALDFELVGD